VVPFVTARLAVRPFDVEDAKQLHAVLYGDPAAMRFLGGPHTLDATVRSLERYVTQQERAGYSFWAVEERETGFIVGEAGLYPFGGQGPEIEVGYALGSPHWGKGYATEVAGGIVDRAFAHLGVDHVVAVAKRENTGSLHVLSKLGFEQRGERDAWGSRQLFFVCERASR
jgi:[ribosomal protein S5]-alanine N-acetyltransferase